jgi:hypothetical protein
MIVSTQISHLLHFPEPGQVVCWPGCGWGNLGLQIANQVVRGRIEWDDAHDSRLPMLIIGGREFTWEDFGRMLMSFEGFHFQLNIRGKSEEF